jgi:hypothetical protein
MPASGLPTPPLVGGTSVRNPILQGYVFQSGLHKPEHSSFLSFKYPQYYLTSMSDRLGASEGVAQDTVTWTIMGRTRFGGTLSSLSAGGSSTITAEITEFDYDGSANFGYLIVGDVILLASGVQARVSAVTVSSVLTNKQKVTLTKQGGGNWTVGASEIANAMTFGHGFNTFGEASDAPTGRLFLPTEATAYLTTLRRSFSVSGDEFTNKIWLDKPYASPWFTAVEDLNMKEFARDREILVMFGKLQSTGVKTTKGLVQYALDEGVVNGYATGTGVSETNIQDQIEDMLVQGCSNEITVLASAKFIKNFQNAMASRYIAAGAIAYGSFGANTVGMDFQTYKFMGKTIHLVYYELFDDTAVLPAATGSATIVNYQDFSLWLDFGSDAGGSHIQLLHKELNGVSRKFIHAYEVGMMGPNGASSGQVSNGADKFTVHLLSQIGLKVRFPNRLGVLRAIS